MSTIETETPRIEIYLQFFQLAFDILVVIAINWIINNTQRNRPKDQP